VGRGPHNDGTTGSYGGLSHDDLLRSQNEERNQENQNDLGLVHELRPSLRDKDFGGLKYSQVDFYGKVNSHIFREKEPQND